MTQEEYRHLITPPPELMQKWCHDRNRWTDFENVLAIRAAEWGYRQRCLEELSDMGQEMQAPNGDFLKSYPDVTRVEVVTSEGREFVRYECSNVQVSLQDDGQTIKVFLFSTYD